MSIGIAIPCYKPHLNKLPLLFKSLVQQTELPDEVVVSCSSMGSIDKYPDFGEYPFKLTIYYHSDRKNAAENRNFAAEKLATDYISFFDADDIMAKTRTHAIKSCIQSGADFITHSYTFKTADLDTDKEIECLYDGVRPASPGVGLDGYQGPIHQAHVTVHRSIWEKCKVPTDSIYERREDSVFCSTAVKYATHTAYIKNSLSLYAPAGYWVNC